MLEGGDEPPGDEPPRDTAPRDTAPRDSRASRHRRAAAPPPREAPPADALDLGSLGGAVVADRLKDPRAVAGLLVVVAFVAYLLGRRAG